MKLKPIIAACIVAVLVSCNKNHYDFDHLNGVAMDGELCAPIASAQYSIGDLMERFHLDTLLVFGEEGDMSFEFGYEVNDAILGSELLRFNDIVEHFEDSIENPHPIALPIPIDTVVHYDFELNLVSDYASLNWAAIKSGMIEFELETNLTHLRSIDISVHEITDAMGNMLHINYEPQLTVNQVDVSGYNYQASTENMLHVSVDVDFAMQEMTEPFYNLAVDLKISNLAIKEMRGHIGTYTSRNRIDTTFNLFPSNLSGEAHFLDAHIALQERNTFGLSAELIVDTAMVGGNGVEPYTIFDEMPLVINLPSSSDYVESFDQLVDGRLNIQCGDAYASSLFVLNPQGLQNEVSVCDTSSVDVKIGVEIPFSFNVERISYVDTVNMNLNGIESPEMIEQMVMVLAFESGLPLNVSVTADMYDSQNEMITETLLGEGACNIRGSFDGHPTTTLVEVPLTPERLENVFSSDKIILHFALDTDAHDVTLNLNQSLGLTIRTRIQYNGVVELSKED